jgi:hypothetical protein
MESFNDHCEISSYKILIKSTFKIEETQTSSNLHIFQTSMNSRLTSVIEVAIREVSAQKILQPREQQSFGELRS